MRILLLDDNVRHRRAGKKELEALGHEVVVMSDYGEARQTATIEKFDAALVDLLMPAEPTTLGPDAVAKYVGLEIGVGFPMILELARWGIPRVAVATDTNHHHHPMSAIVDWFASGPALVVNGARILIMHAPMHEDGTKDWSKVLAALVVLDS